MSQIRILPENLANQIAAGEVVERPASVVKELVENSIDAGATSLTVQVEGGGTSLIRVIDDGRGMDQDDILLSLERHATSKLTSVEQLDDIRTLGFRGEAVPSIASVARLTITSRQADAQLGNRVEIRFGKVVKVHEMGCQTGTVVEVRDLFGNVPARKKFLKTPRTELAHIEEVVRGYALVRSDLAVSYAVNGREVISLPAAGPGGVEQRLKKLLCCDNQKELVRVDSTGDGGEPRISGFLLAPDHFPGSGVSLRAFVNGRAVRDRLITHAVAEGLRNYLMKGRKPSGVLFIDLPPAAVDVNVHPAKLEIRFHKSKAIHQLIVLAVAEAMGKFQDGLKRSVFGVASSGETITAEAGIAEKPETVLTGINPSPSEEKPLSGPVSKKSGDIRGYSYDRIKKEPVDLIVSEPVHLPVGRERRPDLETRSSASAELPDSSAVGVAAGDDDLSVSSGQLRVIGQLHDTYILCEGQNSLVAIDQHAAQERLIFERFKKEFADGRVARQALLFPATIELGFDDIAILEGAAEDIAGMGIDIQEFGGTTYVLKGVPAMMAHVPPEEILRGVLDQFAGIGTSKDRGGSARRLDSILSVMACKAAIKANQSLSHLEMKGLLDEMVKNNVFSHCPHGRPVVRKFSASEIQKWFYRT
ncbi:MAG: DNA mismatch repair endonuclease MutL [Desulfobulbaceae bacterium]|nr:DNA mismatch repair endonuclease MutL [Desulfobulbaceae bacterium]